MLEMKHPYLFVNRGLQKESHKIPGDAINNTRREMLCGHEHAVSTIPRIECLYFMHVCSFTHAAFMLDIL